MRRALLGAGLALAALAAACGPPPTPDEALIVEEGAQLPDCPLDALDDVTAPVSIDAWHGLAVESERALDAMGTRFNESQDAVEVNIRKQGASYEEVLRKYGAAATAGSPPALIYIEDTARQAVVDSGQVFPLEACFEADDEADLDQYPAAVRNYYTTNGFFYPGYVNVSEPVLFYNANHLRQAGLDPEDPPETLEELREVAETLKAEGVVDKPLALKLDAWFYTSWMLGAGQDIVDNGNGLDGPATESDLASDTAVETVQLLKDMADDGLIEPYSDTDGQINQYLALAQQQSTMVIETSTASTTISAFVGGELPDADTGGANLDTSGLDPRASAFPGVDGAGGVRVSGGAFYVSAGVSPAEQLAGWEYLKFMQQEDNQLEWYRQGSYLPVAGDLAADPRVVEFAETTLAGNLLQAGIDEFDSIDPDRPGPALGPYPEYVVAVEDALDRIFFEGMDVRESLLIAQDEVDAQLERYQ